MGKRSVSVIIPCAGMAHFLPNAVGSIQRQDVPVQEILVIHPLHDNDTAVAGRDLASQGAPVVVIEGPDNGPGPARNAGLAQATGEVIAFLDADDLWPEDKLALQMERLARSPNVDAVGGLTTRFEALDEIALEPEQGTAIATDLAPASGMMICRRSMFERIGGFDEDLFYGEDIDLFLRMRDLDIALAVLDAPMLYYRRHANSMMTAGHPRMKSDFRLAALKSVRRRRQLGLPPATGQILTDDLEQWPDKP